MSVKKSEIQFTPNEFYERLIELRETDPSALERFGRVTLTALEAYEKAKHKHSTESTRGKKKGNKK